MALDYPQVGGKVFCDRLTEKYPDEWAAMKTRIILLDGEFGVE